MQNLGKAFDGMLVCLGEGVLVVVLPDKQMNSLGESFAQGADRLKEICFSNFLACDSMKMISSESTL